ncbi:hypothetical protein FKW77_010189 [Venturia effusa]|uniref:Uncharacterized protein n=1 Tax=Venturia effusa TaxID=50376 RepID=A0A517L0E1_9PEZI|nr:hypothetical protein FKW77_010189 [Venturia effusa]
MASTGGSDGYVDPDFVALRDNRRLPDGRKSPTLSRCRPSAKRPSVHVRFEDEPVTAKYSEAASMSSATGSSSYVDDFGARGPKEHPVLNYITTPAESVSPISRSNPHRSRSSTATSLAHHNDNEDNTNPWNFPKLLSFKTQAAMDVIEKDAHGRPLTKRQLGAIRRIVCRPPKFVTAEGQSKPIQPPSHRIVLDIKPLDSIYAPSEVSENPSHRKARSAWNYPRLEPRPPKSVHRPNISEKRKSKAQQPESAVDPVSDFVGGFGDMESDCSEPEVIPEPESAPEPQKRQKGKKGKQKGNQDNQQARKNAKQSKRQSERQSEQQQPEDDFHASQLYGAYNEGAPTERAQLPSELEIQQSPTPSSKVEGWDVDPHISPPLEPIDPPASVTGLGGGLGAFGMFEESPPEQRSGGSRLSNHGRHGSHKSASRQANLENDWGAPGILEETTLKQRSQGSQRSRHSDHGSRQAGSSRSYRSQHESQKVPSSRHSSLTHHDSQKPPSVGAGSVAWGEPEGITGAGAEMWADNPAASIHGSHRSGDRLSGKTISKQSSSKRSNMFGGDLPLDTIFEDAPLESARQRSDARSSKHSQSVKSDGRPSRFDDALDDLDLNEKPTSRHSSGSKKSPGGQSRSRGTLDDWESGNKPASKHGSDSKRSGSHRSRSGDVVDSWEIIDKPASKQGSNKSDGRRSRRNSVIDDRDQPEKSASKQGSHRSYGHRSTHDKSTEDWDEPEKSVSRQGSHSKSGGRYSRQLGAEDVWDQRGNTLSKHGSTSSSRRSKRREEDLGWTDNDQIAPWKGSMIGGSEAGWDTNTSSDRYNQADKGWGDDDRALAGHTSGSRSDETEGRKSSPRSQYGKEYEEVRASRRRSHRSSSESHKTSNEPRASASRSPSKKGTVVGSYIAPMVEDDPQNWHGWEVGDKKSSSKSRSHKSQSEAAVNEWIQGSVKAGSAGRVPVKGRDFPVTALSIGSTATSTTSIDPHAPSLRNDPIESWGAGKVPSDASVGTRFGRESLAGSGFGAPLGSADGWSRSGRLGGETGMGSWAGGSRHSSREIREAAEKGGWDTQTSGGSHHSSHRRGLAQDEQAGGGWDTQTSSSLDVSKVSSRRSHSHRGAPDNWSRSGRLEGETGQGSRHSSRQSSRHPSGRYEAGPVDDAGWNTQTSSSQERNSRVSKRSSARRDASPVYEDDVQGGWDTSAPSSRHSGGSRKSRASAARDDGGWGDLAQQGDWGDVADTSRAASGGWEGSDEPGVGAERYSNLSRKSGSRASKGSEKGGDVLESFF